jgi:hypothetical protein
LLLGSDIDAFVLHRRAYRTIGVPDAVGTALNGINNRGAMVGTYIDSQGTSDGFLRSRSGRYTTVDHRVAAVDHPGDTALGTALYSINDRGQTTGAYQSPIEQARQADTSAAPTTGPLSAGMAPMAAPETPSDARPDGGEIGPAVLTQQPVSVVDRL